ncbi:MAG TPA: pyridoxal-phosphate dependent enzyme, partial [Candidatus Omnitrophota bacterium]|nr:pyridoxal-phosphate dependent enzyme [Candidatus Omnitrophota bacterium]
IVVFSLDLVLWTALGWTGYRQNKRDKKEKADEHPGKRSGTGPHVNSAVLQEALPERWINTHPQDYPELDDEIVISERFLRVLGMRPTPLVRLERMSRMFSSDRPRMILLKDESRRLGQSFKILGVLIEVNAVFVDRIQLAMEGKTRLTQPYYIVTQTVGNHGIAMVTAVRILIEHYRKKYQGQDSVLRMLDHIEPVVFTVCDQELPDAKRLGLERALEEYRICVRNDHKGKLFNRYADYPQAETGRSRFMKENRGHASYMEHGNLKIQSGHALAGIEIVEQLTEMGFKGRRASVIVPVGAGGPLGIIGGFKLAARRMRWAPVFGIAAQSISYGALVRTLKDGKPYINQPVTEQRVALDGRSFIFEDGIAVTRPDPKAVETARRIVDFAATVDARKAFERSAPLLYTELNDFYSGADVMVGGTTSLTAELLFEHFDGLDHSNQLLTAGPALDEAEVIVLLGTEGNVASDLLTEIGRRSSMAFSKGISTNAVGVRIPGMNSSVLREGRDLVSALKKAAVMGSFLLADAAVMANGVDQDIHELGKTIVKSAGSVALYAALAVLGVILFRAITGWVKTLPEEDRWADVQRQLEEDKKSAAASEPGTLKQAPEEPSVSFIRGPQDLPPSSTPVRDSRDVLRLRPVSGGGEHQIVSAARYLDRWMWQHRNRFPRVRSLKKIRIPVVTGVAASILKEGSWTPDEIRRMFRVAEDEAAENDDGFLEVPIDVLTLNWSSGRKRLDTDALVEAALSVAAGGRLRSWILPGMLILRMFRGVGDLKKTMGSYIDDIQMEEDGKAAIPQKNRPVWEEQSVALEEGGRTPLGKGCFFVVHTTTVFGSSEPIWLYSVVRDDVPIINGLRLKAPNFIDVDGTLLATIVSINKDSVLLKVLAPGSSNVSLNDDGTNAAVVENCPHCDRNSLALSRPLFETGFFRIVCDAHPLREGHVLIIPKEHYSCVGEYPENVFAEFKDVFARVIGFLKSEFGNERIAVFEHGIVGQTVFHSHVHLMPFSGKAQDIVPEKNVLSAARSLKDMARRFRDEKAYLFFMIGRQMWFVDTRIGAPRFFRDRFAKALGVEERADWKKTEQSADLMQAFRAECESLQKKFQTSAWNPGIFGSADTNAAVTGNRYEKSLAKERPSGRLWMRAVSLAAMLSSTAAFAARPLSDTNQLAQVSSDACAFPARTFLEEVEFKICGYIPFSADGKIADISFSGWGEFLITAVLLILTAVALKVIYTPNILKKFALPEGVQRGVLSVIWAGLGGLLGLIVLGGSDHGILSAVLGAGLGWFVHKVWNLRETIYQRAAKSTVIVYLALVPWVLPAVLTGTFVNGRAVFFRPENSPAAEGILQKLEKPFPEIYQIARKSEVSIILAPGSVGPLAEVYKPVIGAVTVRLDERAVDLFPEQAAANLAHELTHVAQRKGNFPGIFGNVIWAFEGRDLLANESEAYEVEKKVYDRIAGGATYQTVSMVDLKAFYSETSRDYVVSFFKRIGSSVGLVLVFLFWPRIILRFRSLARGEVLRGRVSVLADGEIIRDNGSWAKEGDGGRNSACLSAELDTVTREILDIDFPGIIARSRENWLRLHREFFGHFAPDGKASDEERMAWEEALKTINRTASLKAGTPPMRHIDFVQQAKDLNKSFEIELRQTDFSYQPRKSLLLMAAMVGRILAGRQAEEAPAAVVGAEIQRVLTEANRAKNYLGFVFPQAAGVFCIDYLTAGLAPAGLSSGAEDASSQAGAAKWKSVTLIPASSEAPLAFLRVVFDRPVQIIVAGEGCPVCDFALLRDFRTFGRLSALRITQMKKEDFEAEEALRAFTFDENTPFADQQRRRFAFLKRMADHFAWPVLYRPYWFTAKRFAESVGRTPQERFFIEKFFALGFMSGGGNERWPYDREMIESGETKDLVRKSLEIEKEAQKLQVRIGFYQRFGLPEAAQAPGASTRQQIFEQGKQVKANALQLAADPLFAPLMRIFVTPDGNKGWLVHEREVNEMVKRIDQQIAAVLLAARPAIEAAQARFSKDHQQMFLCALTQALLNIILGKSKYSNREEIKASLAAGYGLSGVEIPSVKSVLDVAFQEKFEQGLEAFSKELRDVLEPNHDEAIGEEIAKKESFLWDSLAGPWAQTLSLELDPVLAEVQGLRQQLSDPSQIEASLETALQLRSRIKEGDVDGAMTAAQRLRAQAKDENKTRIGNILREFAVWAVGRIEERLKAHDDQRVEEITRRSRAALQGFPVLDEFNQLLKSARRQLIESDGNAVQPVAQDENARAAQQLLQEFKDHFHAGRDRLIREFLELAAQGRGLEFEDREKLHRYFLHHGGGLNYRAKELLESVERRKKKGTNASVCGEDASRQEEVLKH